MGEPGQLLTGNGHRPLRVGHLTTVDMSLALLLETELRVDVEAGFETYGISAPGPYVPRIERLGVRHVPLEALTRSWDLGSDLRAVRDLTAALRRLELDVLHTHNPKSGVLGRLVGRALRIPVVVNTCHGLWYRPKDRWRRKALVLAAEAVAAQASHAELYQNAADRAALGRAVPRRRTRVVGNGIDLERFVPEVDARERVRAALGVAPGTVLVGAVGRQVAEKGTEEFSELARRLGDRARFVWIGPPDPDKRDAAALDREAVSVLGTRDDMPDVYAALDVFVLASFREGFSRSAMEAAACETAMVLSDIRGCREIGVDGEHLLLVPPGDAPRLVAAVTRLIDDPELRGRLARNARKRALEAFDQRAVAAVSIETYEAVARHRRLGWSRGRRT